MEVRPFGQVPCALAADILGRADVFERVTLSASTLVSCYAVGAAAIAFWALVRYPRLGPQRLGGGLLAMVAALLGMSLAGGLIDPVAHTGRFGGVLAAVLVFLPALVAAFWAAGCLLRALAAALR